MRKAVTPVSIDPDQLTFIGKILKNVASIFFGGPDLKTVYLGSLVSDTLSVFRSPVADLSLPH